MFEFHGWANVQSNPNEHNETDEARLMNSLRQYVAASSIGEHAIVSVAKGLNGLHSLTVAGLRNHRDTAVIDLFHWLAQNGLGSYGLLYVRDDADHHGVEEHDNEFRVWRLARGVLTEMTDPFLSPCVPVIEAPYCHRREECHR